MRVYLLLKMPKLFYYQLLFLEQNEVSFSLLNLYFFYHSKFFCVPYLSIFFWNILKFRPLKGSKDPTNSPIKNLVLLENWLEDDNTH